MSINEDDSNKAFDGKTLLAIVLMVVVLTAGMAIQNHFFPRQPQPVVEKEKSAQTSQVSANKQSSVPTEGKASLDKLVVFDDSSLDLHEESYMLSTDLFIASFSNRGGELKSLKLKKHSENGVYVELLMPVDGNTSGFSMNLGGPRAAPVDALMQVSQPGPGKIEFYRTFSDTANNGEKELFVLRKLYEFKPGEYMFKLSISVESLASSVPIVGDGSYAYTLNFGPQIGPSFKELPKNADWRRIVSYEGGKKRKIKPGVQTVEANHAAWSALAGKYFAVIMLPESTTAYTTTFTNTTSDGFPATTAMAFSRPQINSSSQTDVFHIYAGPKSSRELKRYDDITANGFNRTKDDLEAVLEGNNILGWLEVALKWALNLFYAMVGNYGVAIILVTLLVRLIIFPLTFKGSQATARMQDLQPKMQEIQAKYKNNPQKLNQEMAEFYKAEGYNPLSGCFPLLIQFPIFIAMYSLFNNHFDLRGASFIPGWIGDLSLPEAIVSFPTVNLIIWRISAIRLLPIIYLVSQLLYGKFMQQPTSAGQNAGQMKFMMYGMPIMFFFILYDVPSGLLVYWISSNILTTLQQVVINKVIHKKCTSKAVEEPKLKLVPKSKAKNGKK